MFISFNTEDLSVLDKQVLAVLAGGNSAPAPVADKAAEAAARVAAATKTTPAKKTAAAKPDPEPEPEVEEEPVAEETDGEAKTLEDAKAIAMDLVANGGAPKVKAALKVVGAAKVTEMDESDVPAFLAALEDA